MGIIAFKIFSFFALIKRMRRKNGRIIEAAVSINIHKCCIYEYLRLDKL